MTTENSIINQDGSLILNIAIYSKFSDITDGVYSSICGGFIEGVYQWATHNIVDIVEQSNDKYTGWTITFDNGKVRQMYIENYWLNIVESKSDWKFAKNLFVKNIKVNN